MITNYLEIHSLSNHRNLVPIESIQGVAEVTHKTIDETGKEKTEIKCQVLINGISFLVTETYDDIKKQINNIYYAMRDDKEKENTCQ